MGKQTPLKDGCHFKRRKNFSLEYKAAKKDPETSKMVDNMHGRV